MNGLTTTKLKLKEKIGYALGDTAANIAWRGLTFFLTYFYLEVYKLPPVAVGTLLLICRISDGFTDVIMGLIADRTKTRFGRFRPWILWTAVPLGVLMALIYLAPEFSPSGKIIYAYVTYIALTLAYTANNVPYSALMGVMTGDHKERTSLSSFRFFGAYFGGFIVQGFLLYLVGFFGKENEVAGFRNTMFLFAGILIIFLIITFFSTKERINPPASQENSVKSDIKDLLTNRPWLILLVLGLLWVTFNSIKQGVTVLYFKHYMGNKDLATSFMIAGLLISMFAALVTTPLARFFGNKKLFLYSMILTGFFTSMIYIVGRSNVTMVFIFGTVAEFFAGIMPVLFFTMLGDSADYSEWKMGRRATGLVYSAGTFAMKIGFGISGAVIGYVFAFYNYDATSEIINPEALQGTRLLMSFIPTVFIVLAIILLLFYPLTKQTMDMINSELEKRRSADPGS